MPAVPLTLLLLLATTSFLQKLLDCRRSLRESTSLANVGELPSVLITWIDILLARLSASTPVIASGFNSLDPTKEKVPSWLVARQEEDAVRAATQLPGNCKLDS